MASRLFRVLFWGGLLACAGAMLAARLSVEELPRRLEPPDPSGALKLQVVDRFGQPLSYTFASEWNVSDQRLLHQFPQLVKAAFVDAEDRRFFAHSGVDWTARAHAAWQNVRAVRVVRGASTISEQVVRMLHLRPRTLWSRWLEGIEAAQLEQRFTKAEILEFYLNQVPFSGRRRGVVQAARYYFDRDLETLSTEEILLLAVVVRSPERLDLRRSYSGASMRAERLADSMVSRGAIAPDVRAALDFSRVETKRPSLEVRADHFVRFAQSRRGEAGLDGKLATTLDSSLQSKVQKLIEERVRDLSAHKVTDGAVLVVDNRTAEVLAWVNAGELGAKPGSHFDGVLTLRQPGSTLKPFVYAKALEKGWTAATVVDDSPLVEAVGAGLHNFRNYSRVYYGELSVREALGNSLNVPAVKAIQFVGKEDFLQFLRLAGFESLAQPSSFYGEGLALGNGEVTLYELVRAYAALGNRGVLRELRVFRDGGSSDGAKPQRLLSDEVASIIGDVLSDPRARQREFGAGGLLRFPLQTAVKTGTSSDYRDAWAVGFSDNFTVGVWLGNMNRSPMREISGARGPALVLRSVFAELERGRESSGLWVSPTLERRQVCPKTGRLAGIGCPHVEELFVAGSEPTSTCGGLHEKASQEEAVLVLEGERPVRVSLPTPGLNLARDPRVPDSSEAFPLELESAVPLQEVRWLVDGSEVARVPGSAPRHLWILQPGHHSVKAEVLTPQGQTLQTAPINFQVK